MVVCAINAHEIDDDLSVAESAGGGVTAGAAGAAGAKGAKGFAAGAAAGSFLINLFHYFTFNI